MTITKTDNAADNKVAAPSTVETSDAPMIGSVSAASAPALAPADEQTRSEYNTLATAGKRFLATHKNLCKTMGRSDLSENVFGSLPELSGAGQYPEGCAAFAMSLFGQDVVPEVAESTGGLCQTAFQIAQLYIMGNSANRSAFEGLAFAVLSDQKSGGSTLQQGEEIPIIEIDAPSVDNKCTGIDSGEQYIERLLRTLEDLASLDYENHQTFDEQYRPGKNIISDQVASHVLSAFSKERPDFAPMFQHPKRPDDTTDSYFEAFGRALFDIKDEADHEDAFALGAIYHRLSWHPSLGNFLLCAALAAWRLAQRENHRARWAERFERGTR